MKSLLLTILCVMFLAMVGCTATLKETKNFDTNGKVTSSTLELKDYTVTENKDGKKSYTPKAGLSIDTFTNLLKTIPLQ